jgi:signal peptidase I
MPSDTQALLLAARDPVAESAGRPRRALRLAQIAATWALLGLVASFALSITAPTLLGYRTLTVLSGSMEPSIGAGAVVVDEVISPLDARVEDVVTFTDPEQRGRLITHRLRRITVRGRRAYMVTKGDANETVERWSVPADGKIGRVAYSVPKLGYARVWISGRLGRVAVLVALLCLGIWLLIETWRPPR